MKGGDAPEQEKQRGAVEVRKVRVLNLLVQENSKK